MLKPAYNNKILLIYRVTKERLQPSKFLRQSHGYATNRKHPLNYQPGYETSHPTL